MIALTVPASEIKHLMHRLLKDETFGFFELREAYIRSFILFDIHGGLTRDAAETPETAERRQKYALWRDVRPYVFQMIKGTQPPQSMKFVFSMPQEEMTSILPVAAALFLNIFFEHRNIRITTGFTWRTFSLDKSAEQLWDDYIRRFFKDERIAVMDL